MWKKQKGMITRIFLCVLVVVAIGFTYSHFVSREIYEESTLHVEEIYGQVRTLFQSMVTKNWNVLDGWKNYIEQEAMFDPDQFEDFIEQQKEKWSFTEFYFLDKNGNYMTAAGETGVMSFGGNFGRLTEKRENVVLDGFLPGGKALTVFAIPLEKGRYRGFSYSAVAVSYDSAAMMDMLSVDAFSGEAECFIAYSDGKVLISEKNSEDFSFNILEYLRENATLDQKVLDDMQKDWKDGKSGVVRCRIGRTRYYVFYQPIGFKDWLMLGIVPASAVSSSMNQIHWVTASAFTGIFVLLGIIMISYFWKRARKNIKDRILEVWYRERLFGVLSDTVDDIFIIMENSSKVIEYISPNVERLLGISADRVKQDVRVVEDTIDDPGYIDKGWLKELGVDGSVSRECEHIHQKTGERRWYRETAYHVNIQNTDKTIFVLSDRTNERQMNEQLKEALEAAESANTAKSRFLSNMSHDIRTPMNAIVGFATLLGKDAEQPDKVREYTRKITASSQHLLNLINDVLDMSKIESGKTTLNTEEFSIPELLEEIYAILLPQTKAKKQKFKIHVTGKAPELVIGDKLRINQVLINLLSNAMKYTQEGGNIELRVHKLEQSQSHARLRFTVKDNGMGMSEEYLKVIFEPFTREENSLTNLIQGTGLGMAITKNIVDLMGGTIAVESREGEGSTFVVELSLALPELDTAKEDGFWKKYNVRRIFVIDNDEEICREIKDLMADNGVAADYETDSALAPDLVKGCDIVLINWKMPQMDGIETARRIKEKYGEESPFLVLMAYDWTEEKDTAKEVGVDAFMAKPFFVSNFRRTVTGMMVKEINGSGEENAPEETSVLSGMLFLAAEDNELNAEILKEMLKLEGADCELAMNGQEAVELFEKSEPGYYDMILMDVQMPVMNGYEATGRIRTLSRPDASEIPIVAMTANAFAEDVQNALKAGMTAHVAKPIDMELLKNTLEKIKK